MKNTLIVNLLGGPGCGKSTLAHSVMSRLKMDKVNCEYVEEYAKGKTWEESWNALNDQCFIFANQNWHYKRVMGKVDVIITDTSLLNSIIYNDHYGESFNQLVLEEFNKYNNLNIFVRRTGSSIVYETEGRKQNYEESLELDEKFEATLFENGIPHIDIPFNDKSTSIIIERIYNLLK